MKSFLLPAYRWFILVLLAVRLPAAQAQTPDPAFTTAELLLPSHIQHVAVQADGKLLVAGGIRKAEGQPANFLVRYNADGTLDQAFGAAVSSYNWVPLQVRVLQNGQLLVLTSSFTSGSLTRRTLVRLNADGSLDASFDVGTGVTVALNNVSLVEQADGKILMAGPFTTFAGQPQNRIVRLLTSGAVDASFVPPAFPASGVVYALALQADGQILVGGSFAVLSPGGQANLLRLAPNGAIDPTFILSGYINDRVYAFAVQPDGKILVGLGAVLARLLPTGARDTSFQGPLFRSRITSLLLQPDGSVLVASNSVTQTAGFANDNLIKVSASGGRDAAFQVPASVTSSPFGVVTLARLPDGRLVLGASYMLYPTGNVFEPRRLLVLTPTAALSPAWTPELFGGGTVSHLAMQPDGKILVAGNFSRVGGAPAGNVARLLSTGQPDTAFTRQAAVNGQADRIAWHPAGGVVVSGTFTKVGSVACRPLIRLLPTGGLDAGFDYQPQPGSTGESVQYFGLLPDGRILVQGQINSAGTRQSLARLLANGQADNSFSYAPASATAGVVSAYQLPDGRVLMTDVDLGVLSLRRLLPTGAADPSFAVLSYGGGGGYFYSLQADAQDRVLGYMYDSGVYRFVRYTPNNNAPDPGFTPYMAGPYDFVTNFVQQPNGRLLLHGTFWMGSKAYSMRRLLDNGLPDPSFDDTVVEGVANAATIQPDGKVLIGGGLLQVGSQSYFGVLRLTVSNVLAVSPQPLAANTAAWPVPARDVLHLQLDAAARPHAVQLLDATGRTVLTQPVTQPQLDLDLRTFPAGVYLLRIDYATGPVTRRVVVQ